MINTRKVLIRTTSILMAMLVAFPTHAQAVVPTDETIGLHPGTVPADITATGAGSWRLWDLGTTWKDLQPSRDTYNWTPLDTWVNRANELGVTDIVYVFGSTPLWAVDPNAKTAPESTSHGWRGPGTAKPPLIADFRNFTQELVNRYRGRITAYEVWNEANLKPYWVGSPARMAAMTKVVFDVVHSPGTGDPDAVVLAASTTVRGNKFALFYPSYLKELKKRKWPLDAFSAHLYPERTARPSGRVTLIKKFKAALRKAKAPARPIWDTEVNYGLRGYPVKSSLITAYVGQTFLDSRKHGIARTYWYIWGPTLTYQNAPLLGITMNTGTRGNKALTAISAWTANTKVSKCRTLNKLSYCRFDKSSGAQLIAWSSAGRSRMAVPGFAKRACTLAGRCVAVKPFSSITVGMTPVKFSAR